MNIGWKLRPAGWTPPLGWIWCSSGDHVWPVEVINDRQFVSATNVLYWQPMLSPAAPSKNEIIGLKADAAEAAQALGLQAELSPVTDTRTGEIVGHMLP